MELTLVVREDRVLELGPIVASDYNFRDGELAITDGALLVLFGNLEGCAELRRSVVAADGERFAHVLYIEWINAFLVLVAKGGILYRKFLPAGASQLEDATVLAPEGAFLACAKNSSRHEILSADTSGGIKIWSARARPPTATTGKARTTELRDVIKCPQRLHIQDSKCTTWQCLCVDTDNQRIFAASFRTIRFFDGVTGHILGRLPKWSVDTVVSYLVFVPSTDHLLVQTESLEVWDVANLKATALVTDTPLATCPVIAGATTTTMMHGPTTLSLDAVYATKPGFSSVVVTDPTGRVALFLCTPPSYDVGVPSFAVPQLHLPSTAAITMSYSQTNWKSSIHCNFQYSARNFVTLIQTNGQLSKLVSLEVLAVTSTARVLTSSCRLYSLRDFGFTKATREAQLRRGYVLFGSSFVQVFEDTCLSVCELTTERNDGAEIKDASNPIITFLDYSALLGKCIVGWSDGVLDLFTITGKRWKLLKRPSGAIADCICTVQLNDDEFLFMAGDADGCIDTWCIREHVATHVGALSAHTYSILAILSPAATAKPAQGNLPCLMVTVSCEGNVKQWNYVQDGWVLVGFFKTISTHLTVARGIEMQYLVCGSDEGSVEVWRISVAAPPQFATTKKPVVNVARAHARSVFEINVHQTLGSSPDHDFTLVATLAKDGSVLFWYFVHALDVETMVPFRCLAASQPPCGAFFSLTATPDALTFVGCFPKSLDKLCAFPATKKQLVALVLAASSPAVAAVVAPPLVAPPRPVLPPTIPEIDTEATALVHVHVTVPVVDLHMELEERSRSASTRHTLVDTVTSDFETAEPFELPLPTPLTTDLTTTGVNANKKPLKKKAQFSAALARAVPRIYKTPAPPILDAAKRVSVVSAYGLQSSDTPDGLSKHYASYKLDVVARPRKTAVKGLTEPLKELLEHHDPPPPEVHIVDVAVRPPTVADGPVFWLQSQSKAAAARRRTTMLPTQSLVATSTDEAFSLDMVELTWADLTSAQQMVELQCSVLCLAVAQAAREYGVEVPSCAFDAELPASDRAVWNRYNMWYIHKSDARKLFLREELLYALTHEDVIKHAQMAGLSLPKPADADSLNEASPLYFRWARYCAWYSRGIVAASLDQLQWLLTSSDDEPKRLARLDERTSLLRERLGQVEQAKFDFEVLQKRELTRLTAAAKAATVMLQSLKRSAPAPKAVLPPELVSLHIDFFQPIALPNGTRLEFVPWDTMGAAEQEKELALALNDVHVRLEAMRQHIVLPDEVSALALDDEGRLQERCAAFLSWWATTNNPVRMQFLRHEAKEAAGDDMVRSAASQVGIDVAFYTALQAFHHPAKPAAPRRDSDIEAQRDVYHEWYFQVANADHIARLEFLKLKVLKLKRQLRFQTILDLGRMPQPMMFQLAPQPRLAFDADELKTKVEAVAPPPVEVKEPPKLIVEPAVVVEVREKIDYEALARQRRAKERQKWEDDMLVYNRTQMELEDEASRLWRSMDDDDEVEEVEVAPPRERVPRDYTKSYFFTSLPTAQDAYAIAGLGFRAGCGLLNGDEEAEAREIRELERLRQLELDRLDRARIAEEERLMALALAEKEMEDERKAAKRARAIEIKRILAYQKGTIAAQHEMRREEAVAAMEREETMERKRLADLARERALMTQAEADVRVYTAAVSQRRRLEVQRRALDRAGMIAEDTRSRAAAAYELETAAARAARLVFLKELYTPFEPFFPDTERDNRRLFASERPPDVRRIKDRYAIPFGEALVVDTPTSELYIAQPSKRFQALLGVPIDYRRPPSTPYQSVAASMETLARARGVPGLPDPDPAVPMAPRLRPRTTVATSPPKELYRTVQTAGWCPERSATPTRRKQYRRRQTPTTLAELPNNQVADAQMFRQSALPPPFFRGNFSVIGKQPAPGLEPLQALRSEAQVETRTSAFAFSYKESDRIGIDQCGDADTNGNYDNQRKQLP
ncbi:hypothetical protein ACHHYP_04030 [Achlya hypogyna]|uniref:ANTAR domain-containing protein n=1 Tax=Achlya hypogyna TaxID=1202772 RepID=A0A1V9Z265_ACHHY|nr:hypothetical protein ACHHYP_04030 [Achlya hypogyna]